MVDGGWSMVEARVAGESTIDHRSIIGHPEAMVFKRRSTPGSG
jgi:hypothetical protein